MWPPLSMLMPAMPSQPVLPYERLQAMIWPSFALQRRRNLLVRLPATVWNSKWAELAQRFSDSSREYCHSDVMLSVVISVIGAWSLVLAQW